MWQPYDIQMLVSINKALLEYSYDHLFTYCLRVFASVSGKAEELWQSLYFAAMENSLVFRGVLALPNSSFPLLTLFPPAAVSPCPNSPCPSRQSSRPPSSGNGTFLLCLPNANRCLGKSYSSFVSLTFLICKTGIMIPTAMTNNRD